MFGAPHLQHVKEGRVCGVGEDIVDETDLGVAGGGEGDERDAMDCPAREWSVECVISA